MKTCITVSHTMPINPHILVVDDLPENVDFLQQILSHRGYQVSVAYGGHQALTLLERITPHLILLDISMPEMDGYQVCQQIKAKTTTRKIPVVFLSAFSEHDVKSSCLAVGGDGYIEKPFQMQALFGCIETYVQEGIARRGLAHHESPMQ